MLELGQAYELTGVNGDYTAMRSLTSRYFRRLIKVYSQGNGEMRIFAGIFGGHCHSLRVTAANVWSLQVHFCSFKGRLAEASVYIAATTSVLRQQNLEAVLQQQN